MIRKRSRKVKWKGLKRGKVCGKRYGMYLHCNLKNKRILKTPFCFKKVRLGNSYKI